MGRMSERSEQTGQAVGPGVRCGPWVLEQEVGAGASATVYRARNAAGEVAAIKVLQPSAVMPEEVKRFTREFRTLSRLDHPNIVKVYGSGMTGRFPWIAMEHVEGEDLDGVLARWDKESPPDRFEQVDTLFRDLADALTYLHSKGLIHRDIKPSNILMGPDGLSLIHI